MPVLLLGIQSEKAFHQIQPSRTWWNEVQRHLLVSIQPVTHSLLCVAHRGASDYGFDNSQEAFERAAFIGADLFEVDVRTTADGVLVAWHETTTSVSTPTRKMPMPCSSQVAI